MVAAIHVTGAGGHDRDGSGLMHGWKDVQAESRYGWEGVSAR